MTLNVFITGASSGLGEALATAYAERGATLGLVARRKPVLDALFARLRVPGRTYEVDVTDTALLHDAAMWHLREYGCPDIVVANAGISAGTSTDTGQGVDTLRRIFDTNVIALAATFAPFIAAMKARGRGTLVAVSSVAGVRGFAGAGAYCASKSAVTTYCESLRLELRRFGIRVVTIAPGYIDTPMTQANRFPMPFLMPADRFARRALRAIDAGDRYRIIPWQMAWAMRLLRALPDAVFDRVFARAPRKPAPGGHRDDAPRADNTGEPDVRDRTRREGPRTFTGDLFDAAGPDPWPASLRTDDGGDAHDPHAPPRARVKTWRTRATWPRER